MYDVLRKISYVKLRKSYKIMYIEFNTYMF